jgi:hypothetical protein
LRRGLLDAIVEDINHAVLCLRKVSLVQATEEGDVKVHALMQRLTWLELCG